MSDNAVQIEARKWIDSLEDKWRLEVLSKRQRFNVRTGERKDMPTRVRRFAEGIPWAFVAEGVRYLISKAPYRGVLFNGVRLDEDYRPTLTVWRRDAQDTVNSPVQRSGDPTYTIVQDLIAIDEPDLYGAATSASCSEEVVTEWHWDEAEPMDLPAPEQGVTWAIQANRKEDGTFDYALVKRVALTQHTGETVVKDTVTETVRTDSWNNVYTDDEGRYVDNYGAPLDIPESYSADGVVCEVTRQINDDCTFRVNAQWTESKDATVRESCQKTQFDHEHSVSKVGQDGPLGEAPEASGGVIKKHEDQLQPDGKYSTVENTQTELPVEKARVHVTVGRRGRRVERTDRNQPVPASTEGLDIGQSVVVEKTPGKLYNNTTVNFDLSEKQRVAESCEIDLFKHDHSETLAGVDEIPGVDEHVEGSGENGDVKTRRTEMDDEGSVSQTNAVHHEREVLKHRESWQVGLRGVRHSVTDTQTSPANVPSPPTYSKENIGKSVSVEKTPGGLVNITTEDTARETPLNAGVGCDKTVVLHSDTTITNDPDGEFPAHVPDAGGGKYYESQARLNEDGTSTVTEAEHKELEYPRHQVEYRRTAKAIYKKVTDKNVQHEATEPSGIGSSSHTTNPGGTHDVTTTSVDILNLPDRARCDRDVFSHAHDIVEVSKGDKADNSDAPAPGGGRFYQKQSAVDDDGVVTTVVTEHTELPQEWDSEKRKTRRGVYVTHTWRNTPDRTLDADKVGDSVRVVMTQGGRFNKEKTTFAAESVGPVGEQCSRTAFLHGHSTTANVADKPSGKDAKAAGGGHYYEKRAVMTDEGTWDVTDTDNAEIYEKWTSEKRKTRYGVITTTTWRNTTNASTAVKNIGDRVTLEMTPGKWYNRTETTLDRTDLGTIGSGCQRNVFLHSHETLSNLAANPENEAPAAGGGHYYEKTATANEYGSWDVREKDNTEILAPRSALVYHTDYFTKQDRVTDRNTPQPAQDKSDIVNHVIVSTQSEENPGGTFNVTETRSRAFARKLTIEYESKNRGVKHIWWRNQEPGTSQDIVDGLTAGRSNNATAQYNEYGLEDGQATSVASGGASGSGGLISTGWHVASMATGFKYHDKMREGTDGKPRIDRCWIRTRKAYAMGIWRTYDRATTKLNEAITVLVERNRMEVIDKKINSVNSLRRQFWRVEITAVDMGCDEKGKIYTWEPVDVKKTIPPQMVQVIPGFDLTKSAAYDSLRDNATRERETTH